MKRPSLSHLSDHDLVKFILDALGRECGESAVVLAALAEIDERKLYRAAGYSSMYLFCVRDLKMSDDTALKRIRVARIICQFPILFEALSEGRVNQTAVLMLKPRLTAENVAELLTTASGKTKSELEVVLAERFPRADLPTRIQTVAPESSTDQLAPEPVASPAVQLAPEPVGSPGLQLAPEPVVPRTRLAPLSPGRFALQVTVDQATHEQLRYARTLLGHAVPSGDVATVLKRALDALVRELEKKKFARGVSTRPRRGSSNPRYVPADIRRTVSERDGGQCTFVSASGRRCEERGRLEFDHIEPLARGGRTVVSNLRLRCQAHNQYEAERVFGSDFMRRKRDQARSRTEQAKASALARAEAQAEAEAAARAATDAAAAHAAEAAAEVIPFLLHLGFNAKDARQGAPHAARLADAPLEQRVRVALQNLAPPCRTVASAAP